MERLRVARRVARAAGMLVVHVKVPEAATADASTSADVAPEADEATVLIEPVSTAPGGGSRGALARALGDAGVTEIVVAGVAGRPAWAATLAEAAGTDLTVTVLSDGDADHDAEARRLVSGRPGRPPTAVVSMDDWVQSTRRASGRSRRRWMIPVVAAVVVVIVVAVATVQLQRGARKYYEYAPGSAPTITASPECRIRSGGAGALTLMDGTPCARLVVPSGKAHVIDGKLFMVDVLVGPASPWDYFLDKVHLLKTFRDGSQLVPASDVLGSTPASQLGCQDTQQMNGSTEAASVAALSRLGYAVKASNLGAQITLVQPGSAAASAGLQCNDMVTAIDRTPITTADQLQAAIRAAKPGAAVTVTVVRAGAGGRQTTKTLTATLTGTPGVPAVGGSPATPAKPTQPFLGVGSQTQTTYMLPFDVSIQVGDIGGPSAGLALTLGLLDLLSNGNLTGGHRVAATGTIAPDGTVGAVGGVAQKAVAVRRAGAQIFLVPPDDLAAARRESGSHLQVFGVTTLQQALSDLAQAGGHLGSLARQPASVTATAARS